jgi:hypothetical protein
MGYSKLAINMLLNLSRKIKNHRVHFYCLDQEIYRVLSSLPLGSLQITFELWKSDVSTEFENYGSPEYNSLTHQKVQILRKALEEFQFIHFIDSDVVCIQEPSPEHYEEYSKYDIVFQFDCGILPDRELEGDYKFDNWTCTGNTSMRNTPGTKYMLDTITRFQKLFPFKNDQECLRQYFDNFEIKDIRNETRAALFVYPTYQYTNGNLIHNDIYDTSRMYFFHANHSVGTEQKIALLKKVGEWRED